jgi:hypothetical protein
MHKLLTLATSAVVGLLLPLAAHAACSQIGTIPRVFVQVSAPTHIGVRDNGTGTIFYDFTTTNVAVISAAVAAEASHVSVLITGDRALCGVPVNGLSVGGNVVNMLVSP